MNLSLNWLKDYVNLEIGIEEFCRKMTLSGSKVEGFTSNKIENTVIGQVVKIENHPNSDHMFITEIDIGGENIQIVTGAQNVKLGNIVPVALIGADLPNGIKIKKSKLRGIDSCGMLCSLAELGLTKSDYPNAEADGIFILNSDTCPEFENIKIGDNVSKALGMDDISVEFEITSNRPDCLSVIGLARETAATFGVEYSVKEPEFKGINDDINQYLKVKIEETDKCKRYCAGIVKNIKIRQSPKWLCERLKSSGVRPINNIVDITNYVMLEYGQPMHAFDIKYIGGNEIIVRNAVNSEKIVTLDGVERTLDDSMLVIADSTHPVAIAGIMGGEYSGIMEDTTTVVFESAYFEPVQTRKTAKKLGMRSDASARYEKGVDPTISIKCLKRSFELIELLGVGDVVNTIIDINYSDYKPVDVEISTKWVNDFLGTDIAAEKMVNYLKNIDFEVTPVSPEIYSCKAPSFRVDIESKADIAEEIARFYGYENIPSTPLRGTAEAEFTKKQKFIRSINNICAACGCNEIATFSFISPKYLDKINLPTDSNLRNTVKISNPLGEDTGIMRTTILPSMLEIVNNNVNNRNKCGCFFEIGKEYISTTADNLPQELDKLCIGAYGCDTDFYSVKGIIEELFVKLNIQGITYNQPQNEFDEFAALHPYRTATVKKGGLILGFIGEIHPDTAKNYNFDTKVYVAKLEIDKLFQIAKSDKIYKQIPKFPSITRDLSLVVEEKITTAEIENIIKKSIGDIFESITLVEIYSNDKLKAEGKKSLCYSIVMRSPEGTLTAAQADDAIFKNTLKSLENKATLR